MQFKQWQVTKEESGIRLLQFLRDKLEVKCSLRFLKQSLEKNLCRINGRVERFASTVVGWGDEVEFLIDLQQSNKSFDVKKKIPVLYEDDDFLIIDKPVYVSSEDIQLLESLKTARSLKYLAPAHRLDKETSGVLIFVKSETAKKAMISVFREQKILKSYYAIVQGIPKESKGQITNFLGRIASYAGQSLWGAVKKGILAITEWKVIKKGDEAALLACYPRTGRTHQIRVHLAGMDCPILGDSLYNKSKSKFLPKRCLLHASKIEFIHPINGLNISVESPLPADFVEALDFLNIEDK